MKIFLVCNDITSPVIKGLNALRLNGDVSITNPRYLNSILNKLEAGDLLIIENIDIFKSSTKLHSVLSLVSKLEASFISLGERVLLIENGSTNEATLEFISVLSQIEVMCENHEKNSTDSTTNIEGMSNLKLACMSLLHEKFSL